jgi:hypothetical protein
MNKNENENEKNKQETKEGDRIRYWASIFVSLISLMVHSAGIPRIVLEKAED